MNRTELVEAAAAVRRCAAALLAAPPKRTPALATAVGDLSAKAETLLQTAAIGGPVARCFEQARAAGLNLVGVAAVRADASAAAAVGRPAAIVVQLVLRQCLVADAQLIAATTFQSRDDVDAIRARATVAFDMAADEAADMFDQPLAQSITALHAAVVRDLAARSRPLPRMTHYSFGATMPSLTLANRLYGDAARADELQAENRARHPLFMAREIRALTA